MRRSEGSYRDKSLIGAQHSANAVNLCAFDRLLERHRRNDGGNAFRQHRFARTRRADHEEIVSASDGDFDRPFHVSLAFHVAEVDLERLMTRKEIAQITTRWLEVTLAADEREGFAQVLHAVDID